MRQKPDAQCKVLFPMRSTGRRKTRSKILFKMQKRKCRRVHVL